MQATRIKLSRDLARFNEISSLERQNEILRNINAKGSIKKHQQNKKILKINNLGSNAPLSKYYRDRVSPLSATNLFVNLPP